MFLDCFQLSLEKVKLIESVDRSTDTTHTFVIMWSMTLELVWTICFLSFFLAAVLGHELNFDWAVNPPRHQILRIAWRGLRDDVIPHDKWRHLCQKYSLVPIDLNSSYFATLLLKLQRHTRIYGERSYNIEGDSCPRSCYFLWFMLLSVDGSCFQLFTGPFDMTAVSQYLWA